MALKAGCNQLQASTAYPEASRAATTSEKAGSSVESFRGGFWLRQMVVFGWADAQSLGLVDPDQEGVLGKTLVGLASVADPAGQEEGLDPRGTRLVVGAVPVAGVAVPGPVALAVDHHLAVGMQLPELPEGRLGEGMAAH